MHSKRAMSRRAFVGTSAGTGLLLGLGELPGLRNLPMVSSAEASQVKKTVTFTSDIEPTVRFLEDTPRDRILEELLVRVKKDLSYRETVAALFLAGIRNIPGSALAHHRNVGGALHAVLVVHSAHLASLNSVDRERWLPILWAVDNFKHEQSQPKRVNASRRPTWQMPPLDESTIPTGTKARAAFVEAMENWDEGAADVAAAGLARSSGSSEVFDLLCRYGSRDYRYIGHKAIFVANAWRTLQSVGWRHAEPVLRSLARALTAYWHSKGHPARSELRADRCWRRNTESIAGVRVGWQSGNIDESASTEFLATLRQGSDVEASDQAVELLNQRVSPHSLWDSIKCAACEMIMRKPNFGTLHASTTMNALHYTFQTSGNDETRRLILLQAAGFATLFREDSNQRLTHSERIDGIEPIDVEPDPADALDEIFMSLETDRLKAARKALSYLQNDGDPTPLIQRAQQLINRKGDNAHDYKFASAVREDFWSMSSPWRERQLAATLLLARGPREADTAVFQRIQTALG